MKATDKLNILTGGPPELTISCGDCMASGFCLVKENIHTWLKDCFSSFCFLGAELIKDEEAYEQKYRGMSDERLKEVLKIEYGWEEK